MQISWNQGNDLLAVAQHAKKSFAKPFFMEVALIACWNIWKLRNDRVFKAELPRFLVWKKRFIHDMLLHVHRFPEKNSSVVKSWIDGLPWISLSLLWGSF